MEDHADEFNILAARMLALAKTMPGFLSYRRTQHEAHFGHEPT